MVASYKNLFKLLIDRNMKSKDLAAQAGISPATLVKMKKDGAVVSVVVTKATDTAYVGDKIKTDPKFVEQFVGLTIDTLEVDAIAKSTISCASAVKAVYTALQAAQ